MSQSLLDERIKTIQTVFDTSELLGRHASAQEEIAKYYRLNRLAYKFVNSKEGFVHMGISRDGVFKEKDFLEHAKLLSQYIDLASTASVLELAAGKAATTKYLANKYPTKSFTGFDLPNGQMNTNVAHPTNLTLDEGNYHDLSRYKADSFDLVYIIEALCHSPTKEKVVQEVERVLKPGGYFIIFDGYSSKARSEMNKIEATASDLTYLTMMVDPANHYYQDLRAYLLKAHFDITFEENLSAYVLPSMKRLEEKAVKFFKHPRLAKLANTIIPKEVTANAVAAYLMPITVTMGLHQYWVTVARKGKF